MSPRSHVALVSAFPPGRQSLNEYGLHLANGLAAREDVAKVSVIADTLSQEMDELTLNPKIAVSRCWTFNSALAGPRILKKLSQAAPDFALWNIQTASFGDREIPAALGLLAPPLARMMGYPSGVIAHNIIAGIDLNNTQLKGAPMRQMLVRAGGAVVTRAMLGANYTTVTLSGYLETLRAKYPKANVHLVPHGTFDVDVTDYPPLQERSRNIVTMGKFGTYKRLETLIEAFLTLKSQKGFDDLKLIIGGSDHPSVPGYMEDLARTHAQQPDVEFRGYIAEEDIADFFGSAWLSVFDYTATTGSSGVLHQTASYGTVPVFPRIGDFIDLCKDEGLSGAHYEPGNSGDMAKAMSEILADTERAQRIADQNALAAGDMPFSEVIDFHMKEMERRRVTAHHRDPNSGQIVTD